MGGQSVPDQQHATLFDRVQLAQELDQCFVVVGARTQLEDEVSIAAIGFVRQGTKSPIDLSALLAIEFSSVGQQGVDSQSQPTLGLIVSRRFTEKAAVYAEPIWVNNSNPLPSVLVDSNDSFLLGVGGRFRVRRTVYLVAEVAPRAAGYRPGASHATVGLEKLVGGHVFQVNFSNGVGTTIGQVARGGSSNKDWYLGFNISRKFWR